MSRVDETAFGAEYKYILLDLLKLSAKVSDDISQYVTTICEYSRLIIHSMENDPRDVVAGDKFLKRYLPAAQSVLVTYIELANKTKDEVKKREITQKVKSSLSKLSQAFLEQHHRLLENDLSDLNVEISMIDKLLKMEGFSVSDKNKGIK